jgi:hypothetical protein
MIYQEKIFTKEECDKIISYQNVYLDLIFRHKEPSIDLENRRIDNVGMVLDGKKLGKFFNVWDIVYDVESEWMFEKLLNWFSKVSNIKCNSNNKLHGCSLHKYSKGDSFTKHIDLNPNFPDRRWNLGIQLNDEYTGGEYICYDKNNNEIVLSKEVGTAVAYNSRTLHEIKEILSGERWSIVAPVWKNHLFEKKNVL